MRLYNISNFLSFILVKQPGLFDVKNSMYCRKNMAKK